jgi:DNA-binding IscR family transcriptional regulator
MLTTSRIDYALLCIRGLFLEAPGAIFSASDIARGADVDDGTCERLLHALASSRFLARPEPGQFCLRSAPDPVD